MKNAENTVTSEITARVSLGLLKYSLDVKSQIVLPDKPWFDEKTGKKQLFLHQKTLSRGFTK